MSDSSPDTPGSLTPGPATPVEPIRTPMPNPVPATGSGLDLDSLTAEDIKAQLVARERDMKYQIAAIKNELAGIADDINIGNRPFSDIVRASPVRALGLAGAMGAAVGILLGIRSRRKRRPQPDDGVEFIRARLATVLDEAAWKVARGAEPEEALRRTLKTVPAIYSERHPVSASPETQATVGDMLVKSALGFGLKMGLDMLTKRLTDHEETFEALADTDA